MSTHTALGQQWSITQVNFQIHRPQQAANFSIYILTTLKPRKKQQGPGALIKARFLGISSKRPGDTIILVDSG